MEAEDDQENNGSCEKGLSSSNFKVKINLKLKKNKDESCGDEDVREEKNLLLMKQKKDHICCECGKEFSSGKALGGHMSSAHVQANQRLEESWKKKKYSIKRSRFDDYDDEEEVVLEEEEEIGDVVVSCEICHKNFPSKKSLFGHMRCHPDREWRGMKPPSKKISKNKGFQATFEDVNEGFEDRFASLRDEEEEGGGGIHFNVVELPLLKDWGAKDRRGRSPLKRSVSSTIMDDDKELHDAVQQLISLVNGDVNNNNNNNNNRSEVMMSSSNSVGSAPKEAVFCNLKDKSKKKGVVDDTEEKNREETKKRKREKELVKLESGQDLVHIPVLKKSVEVKYKCNECGRMFATHQALGGHRSSHNKFKISIENTIDGIKGRNQEENNSQDHGHQDVQLGNQEINNYGKIIINDNNNNVHKCKFCDKIFPTGQALGGHQRSHLTNNQEESSSQNASKVLDFDLNELPHLDDDTLL
ncbi:zinc finger protein ZAT9-like [Solanum verrucosum]|uniref:zinc finger protein ZAT9-like n=1 Tax=Solanum verrucosum TaxID=315347 RepID=UPI0020D06481|nr:zinc finger protein ZAT9-like [Solanum verrucosum]